LTGNPCEDVLVNMYAVIMSGGVGSRFWPVSRVEKPKQFLSLTGGNSLIRETFDRVLPIIPRENIYTVTGRRYVDLIREELPELLPSNLLAEPVGKNTAPCIGYACSVISARDEDAVVVILPADHYIRDADGFRRVVKDAAVFSDEKKTILTIGIKPALAETGYGYIHASTPIDSPSGNQAFKVSSFLEKPDPETARSYVEAGDYFWNAGIFISPAAVMLGSIRKHLPEMSRGLSRLTESFGTEREAAALEEFYRVVQAESIDYGVMEREKDIYMVRGEFGWSDLGSWGSTYHLAPKDEENNALISGELLSIDSRGCYVDAEGKIVVLIGVSDLVAVSTNDAILICKKELSQKVKEVVELLKSEGRSELL